MPSGTSLVLALPSGPVGLVDTPGIGAVGMLAGVGGGGGGGALGTEFDPRFDVKKLMLFVSDLFRFTHVEKLPMP